MYVCTCNPFSDKAVKACFDTAAKKGARVTVSEVYKACTDGKTINESCHACAPMLADMTKDHNRKIIPILPVRDPL